MASVGPTLTASVASWTISGNKPDSPKASSNLARLWPSPPQPLYEAAPIADWCAQGARTLVPETLGHMRFFPDLLHDIWKSQLLRQRGRRQRAASWTSYALLGVAALTVSMPLAPCLATRRPTPRAMGLRGAALQRTGRHNFRPQRSGRRVAGRQEAALRSARLAPNEIPGRLRLLSRSDWRLIAMHWRALHGDERRGGHLVGSPLMVFTNIVSSARRRMRAMDEDRPSARGSKPSPRGAQYRSSSTPGTPATPARPAYQRRAAGRLVSSQLLCLSRTCLLCSLL